LYIGWIVDQWFSLYKNFTLYYDNDTYPKIDIYILHYRCD